MGLIKRNLKQTISLIPLNKAPTPLSKRIYSESSDQEMDIWLQVKKLYIKILKKKNSFAINSSNFVPSTVSDQYLPSH